MNMNKPFTFTAIALGCLTVCNPSYSAAAEATPPNKNQNIKELPSVTVTESRDIGQFAEQAKSSTKGSTPLIKVPIAVQVVPEALIQDEQANTLREAMQTVSGVFSGSTSVHEDIIVRGFPVYQSYRNGIRTFRFGPTEVTNVERIEILKGPSSTQFGRGDVSGLFNVVTKKPQKDKYYSVQQQIGSEEFFQTSIDATGPLNQDKTVLYRLNAAYEDADSFRDFVYTKRQFVAPSLTWSPNKDTEFNLGLEYARHDNPIDRGVIAVGDRPADVPRERNFGESFTRHVNESKMLTFDWSHRFNETWQFRQNLMVEQGRGKGLEYLHQLQNDNQTLDRLPRHIEHRDVDTQYTSFELAGTPIWTGMKHDLVLGIDGNYSKRNFDFWYGDFDTLDIYNPVYVGSEPPTQSSQDTFFNRTWGSGIYIQDQINLTDKLNLMLGGRYDRVKETSENPVGNEVSHLIDTKFSPRVGLVYSFGSGKSAYAAYTESFSDVTTGTNFSGEVFKPIEAEQYEVGFKAESANKDLFTTVALYELTKKNILTPDSVNLGFSIQTGEARSRGLEWDIGGRLTSHLNLTASYAYTDANVTQANDLNQGYRMYGVPRHAAKIFARYDMEAGGNIGFSFGGGLVALSNQQGDTANSFQIPGYTRFDLMAVYKWQAAQSRWTAQVNLQNVTDKTYYLPSGAREEIALGKPRTLMALLRWEY